MVPTPTVPRVLILAICIESSLRTMTMRIVGPVRSLEVL
jgi:hypothetical protein